MTRSARLTLMATVGVSLAMLALAFAAKPLYDTFCRVTGFGGTTRVATAKPSAVLDRQVSIRFDANVSPETPLKFRPVEHSHPIRLGETGLAFYEVTNTSDEPVEAIATYNVAPHKTGPYFNKLECFCFEDRVFAPGETMKLPVVFFVDPALNKEAYLDDVRTITLSYTFYRSEKTAKTVREKDGAA
ncbi:MAG: cytochrome c oxidase assembly protein [Pseudomonadota bacterium]